jgi:UDP-3-O-[3-hydroxymyristoyl] glucosamine N-acyltransferase
VKKKSKPLPVKNNLVEKPDAPVKKARRPKSAPEPAVIRKSLAEIAGMLGARIENAPKPFDPGDVFVSNASGLQNAGPESVSFFKDHKYEHALKKTRAAAVIAQDGIDASVAPCPVIRVKNTDLAFNMVIYAFVKSPLPAERKIDERAAVAKTADIGPDVYIGPFAVIEEEARIGRGSVVFAGVYVGKNTVIGEECVIWPNVTIREDVTIGNRVIIHSGSVIGSDGFGFAPIGKEIVKLPQIGTVLIEDDVEIGACVTIDRARFDKTIISRGAKLDNLIHIAHNVTIGGRSMLAAQVGIAGSTTIGSDVMFGGQVGVSGHLFIGNGVRAAGKTGITKSHPDGVILKGNPGWDARREDEVQALTRRLPEMRQMFDLLEERIKRLEEKRANN